MGEVGRRIRLLAGAALIGALTAPVLAVPPLANASLAAIASPAAYPGSDGRIAFVSKGNIFSILPDGKSLTKLTRLGHASGPRWSPDGAKLAYLYRGNLWIMNANGSGKTRITAAAPRFTDGRATWSPNGRYLAFVKARAGRSFGYLTRYDTVTHRFVTFTGSISGPHVTPIQALPGTAVAWQWARNAGDGFGSFLLLEGAAAQCQGFRFCLTALGFPHQDRYRQGFASAEFDHSGPTRFTDPDWFPNRPAFATQVLTSVENCSATPCTHTGLRLTITSAIAQPGAYQGVYAPGGDFIAYVKNIRSASSIFTLEESRFAMFSPVFLAHGTEPDWQPTKTSGVANPAGPRP
jgi:hypothetical protein